MPANETAAPRKVTIRCPFTGAVIETMTDQELIAIAATHIDATEHALGDSGHFFSYQESMSSSIVFLVNDDDMLDLGRRLHADEADAYSHWCSDTTAEELTLANVTTMYPSATDIDALEAECTASGDVRALAVLAHLAIL